MSFNSIDRTSTTVAAGVKRRGADKVYTPRKRARLGPDVLARSGRTAPKPPWLRVRLSTSPRVAGLKKILRAHGLSSVCEEAQCPNLSECFSKGTTTFMILGDICTRRCAFCDVAHGVPLPLDEGEPVNLAEAVAEMGLRYVVITSVDRDDLADGGAMHFASCVRETRARNPGIHVEILVPDFRNRMEKAIPPLVAEAPDVFNHNLETVPELYRTVRPGARYRHSLSLLLRYKEAAPHVPTKSGLMLGLGERDDQVLQVLRDLRAHRVDMLTLGQYLQPGVHHLPVRRFVTPDEFEHWKTVALNLGFSRVASAPLVRSSYHAEEQAREMTRPHPPA